MAVSYKFLSEVPSKLDIQCKEGVYFLFTVILNGNQTQKYLLLSILICVHLHKTFVTLSRFWPLKEWGFE